MDFLDKYRPLRSPDDAAAATDGAAAASPAAAITPPAGAQDAAPAAAAPAPSEIAVAAAKPADAAPSLLEEAAGKPKADGDAAAAKADAGAAAKKDDPAPADAAKPDDPKDNKADGDKPKDDVKDKDAAKADPDTKDATAAEPPAPITYEAFKLPDGVRLDDKELQKFSEFAGKAQIPQDVAQGLVDLYVAERQNDVTQARAEQRRVWDAMNDTWKTELRNDPELGGNRLETSLSLAKAVVEEYLPANEVGEYFAHLRNNGMGNYKLHVKLLHNIGKALNVFEDGIVPANPQAPKPQKGPGNRGWYPSMNGGPQA